MGRLTLNVLLSFAQFERELASERVRDKVAASRKKGKWTGGTVPLGYEARDKKLVINKTEAQTVRTIFQLYLELRSFGRLVAELDRRRIVTKRRNYQGRQNTGAASPSPTVPSLISSKTASTSARSIMAANGSRESTRQSSTEQTFDQVQQLLKENNVRRGTKFSESGALLKGKLFDDKGNRMGPTFSSKNGVRYRFYISTALRGRKHKAGSVRRISAPEIENLVEAELRSKLNAGETETTVEQLFEHIQRVVVSAGKIQITLGDASKQQTPD